MQLTRQFLKMPGFVPVFFLPWLVAFFPATLVAQDQGKVEIVIRDSTYEVQAGVILPDQPATIVVKNLDKIEHGFTSVILEEGNVQVESKGVTTFGKGIRGVHIAPGSEARIHFVPTRQGKFSFQCDLHPSMKGELFIFRVGAA